MKEHSQLAAKGALVLAVVFFFGGFYLADPGAFYEIWHLLKRGEVLEIAAYIHSFGKGAAVFAFVLTAVMNAVGFPPAMIFSTACTLIFGIVPGILLAWAAETVGAGISFIFFRTFLRDSAEKLISGNRKLKEWDEKSRKDGFRVMLIAPGDSLFPGGSTECLRRPVENEFPRLPAGFLHREIPSHRYRSPHWPRYGDHPPESHAPWRCDWHFHPFICHFFHLGQKKPESE